MRGRAARHQPFPPISRRRRLAARPVPRRLLRAHRAGEGSARAGRRLHPAAPRAAACRARGCAPPAIWRRTQQAYLDGDQARRWRRAGLAGEFTYHGAVDRAGKLAFLQTLDVLSVPATYDEPKGLFLLEAMAAGVPVVQPRRGAFTEIVEKTGGGLLGAEHDRRASSRQALMAIWRDPDQARRSGAGVRRRPRAVYARAHGRVRRSRLRRGTQDNPYRPRSCAIREARGAGDPPRTVGPRWRRNDRASH